MKETKELDELAGTDKFGGTGSDNSRPMVAWIKEHVNYYYSTSISQIAILLFERFRKEKITKG
jgi:hypothetical protein